MAKRKHVELVLAGPEAIEKWREKKKEKRLFPKLNLKMTNFRGDNLTGCDLSHADLTWSDLRRANLSNTTFRGATLWAADLRGADLSGADLSGALMGDADLEGAVGVEELSVGDIRGYRLFVQRIDGRNIYTAGCRRFSYEEAMMHWPSIHVEHDYPDRERASRYRWAIAKHEGG